MLVNSTTAETSSTTKGVMEVKSPNSADAGIFVRKTASYSAGAGIHVRSGSGIVGPVIKAVSGSDGNDYYSDAAIIAANASTNGNGIWGVGNGTGKAGLFWGDVSVTGNLAVSGTMSKGGGSFKIDHPLDPKNKYLLHSFVESPDMMNVYNGNVVLDGDGTATVTLPDWFEALNRDFRYQLTPIGAPASLYVAEEISGNRFRIAGGSPGTKVSWQVTGIRQDAWANQNRIPVELAKAANEKGKYLYPKAYGAPPEEGIDLSPGTFIRTPAPAGRPQ
jgi:hypothetical protein